MADRPRRDAFRARWLVLALDALGLGERLQADKTVDLRAAGETVRLASEGGHLVTTSDLRGAPDVVVGGAPPALLGVAAGAIPPASALRKITLQPRTAATTRWFRQTFPP